CRVLYDMPTVITEPALLEVVEVILTDVSGCYGNTNGMIEVAATGGTGTLLYSIDGGTTYVDNGGMFDNLGAGTYDIFVSDESGCIGEYAANSVVINEPNPMTILVTSTDVSTCNGGMDGMISINATGGTADYSYSIDGGTTWSSTGNFTDLLAGDYDVVIEDANGCMQDYSGNPVMIGEPAVIEFGDVAVTDLGCFGADDGAIMMSGTGGTGMLMFSVDGGMSYQSSGDFMGLSAGEYLLMIKDANGCEMAYENNPVVVEDGTEILIEEVIVTHIQCSGELGSITITASGGIGDLMYSINGGTDYFETNVFTDLISDTYVVRVMDENGCDQLYDGNPIVILNATPSMVTITANPGTEVCTGADVELTAEAEGAVSYTWSNGETTPSIIVSEVTAGVYEYTCEVVNQEGCESDAMVSIEFIGGSAVTIMVNPENGPYCVNEPVELEAVAEDAVSFDWQPGGLSDPIIEVTSDVVQTVEYTVTVINSLGCESMASVEIEYDICESLPELESDMMTIHVYPNPSNGEFSLELTGMSQEVEISVIDFAGRLVLEDKILEITADKMEKQFDFSDYERGVYFLRITHGGKVSYKKVVIQ
ncbi:T9SS type A sorting domain-containing protein, partial [Lentimicrobium sp. S6]|uniref:T9SS type A sorting domain-containing protein n=1 Tax=Lentimicrobium sp. S6 TaxID=2735872 RepID=UPI0015558EDE